jgi:antitoxin (DNA-binding transcriptional repressor) of toxin-antitoxin stability system
MLAILRTSIASPLWPLIVHFCMTTASIREARNRLTELARRVEQGETIVVTRYDQPVLDLVPHRPRGRLDLAAGERFKARYGIARIVPAIPGDFDDPLPEDILLPLPPDARGFASTRTCCSRWPTGRLECWAAPSSTWSRAANTPSSSESRVSGRSRSSSALAGRRALADRRAAGHRLSLAVAGIDHPDLTGAGRLLRP